jgi:hypothetical protein
MLAAQRAAARLHASRAPCAVLRGVAAHARVDADGGARESSTDASASAAAPAAAPPPPPLAERWASSGAPLYEGHIRLSAPQRVAVALGAAVGALFSPARADLVAAFGCAAAPRRACRAPQQRGCV